MAARWRARVAPVRDDPPVLYCAENDHDAVAALRRRSRAARVVDCVVDRVCTAAALGGAVGVAAEPWGGSICVVEPGLDNSPFDDRATLAASAEHAAFLSKRKASLVNGMHTVLSFLTLQEVGPGGATLLKYSDMRRSNQRLVEAWRTVRVAELLEEFGADRVNAWGPGPGPPVRAWCALLDFADEVLVERFSKVDDRVKRVLGGGVEDRFETRLMPAGDWRWWADKTNGDEPAPAYSR
ncbi:hypothetical protein JL721_5274 [Aureococcus anophagefferens]|nr:hypothetical protein JL721_5274 [Aureococcus anophagefferens]